MTLVNGWVPVSIMARGAANATITLVTRKSLADFANIADFLDSATVVGYSERERETSP